MVDVTHRRCEYKECNIVSPAFDIMGGKGRFCFEHKSIDMVNVKAKFCEIKDCKKSVYYGKPGHKMTHCFNHREKGMIRRSNSKCTDCKELAIWGMNWVPKHCEKHKTDDEQNLVERNCSSCNLLYILDKTDKCENCNPISWARTRLAKQNALMDYLDSQNLKGLSTDTMVDNGVCGKERPDRIYDFGDKIIILECDENQHQERPCICEQTRMVNIGQTFGGTPVYFIRWNPDDYTPENDKKVPETLKKRHKLCADFINDIKDSKTTLPIALVSAIYMYYDGWSSLANEKWQILTPFI